MASCSQHKGYDIDPFPEESVGWWTKKSRHSVGADSSASSCLQYCGIVGWVTERASSQ